MPFVKTNDGSADWSDYQTRTNKLTNAGNVQILKGVDKPGCCDSDVDINLSYVVASSGAQITFTEAVAISGLRYYKIYVTDGVGNEATGLIDVTSTTTPLVLDTSALDAGQDYCVEVIVSQGAAQPDCNCENKYRFEIAGPASDPSGSVATADTVGALSVAVESTNGLAKTTVADGGSQAVPNPSIGDTVLVTVYITNTTADSLVNISSVVLSGDGSLAQAGFTPLVVDDALENNAWVISLDTTAGVKTTTLTITSDDAASPYNFNLTYTPA